MVDDSAKNLKRNTLGIFFLAPRFKTTNSVQPRKLSERFSSDILERHSREFSTTARSLIYIHRVIWKKEWSNLGVYGA